MGLNALVVIVLLVIVFCGFNGLRKGVFGIVYGFVSWIFVFAFVIFSHPYINTYLHENTHLYAYLTEKTQDYLNGEIAKFTAVGAAAPEGADLSQIDIAQLPSETVEAIKGWGAKLTEQLPGEMADELKLGEAATPQDLYDGIASGITEFLIKGISVAIAFVTALVIAGIVGVLVAAVGDLPGLQGINLLFGLIVGAFQGLLYVWIFMYIAALLSATGFGQTVFAMIQENAFLTYLYQHNLVLMVIQSF